MEETAETAADTMAAAPAGPAPLTAPEWFVADHTARTVTLQLSATPAPWTFNGISGATGEIVIPEGYTVTVNFTNNDTAMAHSLVVNARAATYPSMFTETAEAFPGAATASPQSLTEATLPGETETITFVASTAGDYVFLCQIAGHAVAGMYLNLTVVAGGTEAGVRQ
jgi:FtsP/CotA-like multicopper oxidase with cupredoxin domain